MRQTVATLVLVLLAATSVRLQEHAPIAAQCQADQAVWVGGLDSVQISKIGVEEINKRMWEMAACQKVDSLNSAGYVKVATDYLMALNVRYYNFIERHNLGSQFLQEDAEGKR
jgi:hypothetical protein